MNATPGPWIIGKGGRLQTVPNAAGGCTVIVDESLRFNPDGALIAAAPELLDALRDCVRAINAMPNTKHAEDLQAECDMFSAVNKARKAIKKAAGLP